MATDLSHVRAEEYFIRAVVGSGFIRPAPAYEDAAWLIILARRVYSCLERCRVEAHEQAAKDVCQWAKTDQEKRRRAFAETGSYSTGAADWPGNLFSEPTPWAGEFKLTVAVAIHDYCVAYLGANAERIDPFGDVERIDADTVSDREWLGQLCLYHQVLVQLSEAQEHIDGMKLAECVDFFGEWCETNFEDSTLKVDSAIWYDGERSYSMDNAQPIVVSATEHAVLQEFLGSDAARDTAALKELAENPSKVIGQLAKKFPGAVRRPAAKGDGYFILVKGRVANR
jgi:hypothetical protein